MKVNDVDDLDNIWQQTVLMNVYMCEKMAFLRPAVNDVRTNARNAETDCCSITYFLDELQRIAFRLLLSSCVCVCVCLTVCVPRCGPQENGLK